MKKLCFPVFLIVTLFLVGCRENYLAEKEFWKAERVLQGIRKTDIQARGPEALEPAVHAFEKVVDKYPQSPKSAESLFVIANIRVRQKHFEDARSVLARIVRLYSGMENNALEARYGIAQLYEVEGNWPKAERVYWDIVDYHPLQPKGLYAPIHVIVHYKKLGDQKKEAEAYDRAVTYYEKKFQDIGPIRAAAAIQNYHALADLAYGQWEKAKDRWLTIPKEFPQSAFAPLAYLTAGELCAKKQDFDCAQKAYGDYLAQFPNHPLAAKTAVQLGTLYLEKREYAKSRQMFEKALDQKDKEAVAEASLLIGRSYQEEGNWEEAEKAYRNIEKKYPGTLISNQVPLLQALHYEAAGDHAKADDILNSAVSRYQQLEKEGKDFKHIAAAKRLQNEALAQKGEWKHILENFDKNIEEEKSPLRKGNWLFLKAVITENRLKNKTGAVSIYKDFLAQYPNHPLAQSARTRLAHIAVQTVQTGQVSANF